ncbi:MAG: FecR family protein [Chitinophagaceae bacterium]|nr:FecR family protein [Chitinophagaceae bacterium]
MTVDKIWYILGKKLNGEASHDEIEELSQILAQHPELYYSIQNITDIWKLDKQDDKQEAFDALQNHLMRLADSRGEITIKDELLYTRPVRSLSPTRNKYLIYSFAAAAVIAIFSYFLFFNSTTNSKAEGVIAKEKEYKINEISTKTGSHSKIILPDGSLVWLNGGSRIAYDKTFNKGNTREVELTGEAYFDVTKNALKPFIIHTHQMDIKVLGTAFNVKSYPEDKTSETSLIHGAIEVTMRQGTGEKIILKPKDKLIVTGYTARLAESKQPATTTINPSTSSKISSISYLPSDSTIIETSWVDDKLIIRDKPFAELSADLERKYGVVFSFQSEKAKALKFSANFKNENIEQALKALQLANKFSYSFLKDTIIISN